MDPGTEVAVESHVADQALFVANLRKRLEASEEEAKCTASVQDQPAPAAPENGADESQSHQPEDDTEALEDASRKAVHVRFALHTLTRFMISNCLQNTIHFTRCS